MRALYLASQWCADPENLPECARILARPDYLGLPAELIGRALTGRLITGGTDAENVPGFFTPFANRATHPRIAHGLWFYAQMVRWGHVQHTRENAQLAQDTFRPDLYRTAFNGLAGASMGNGGGETPSFFDGKAFDPSDLQAYIASQRPYA